VVRGWLCTAGKDSHVRRGSLASFSFTLPGNVWTSTTHAPHDVAQDTHLTLSIDANASCTALDMKKFDGLINSVLVIPHKAWIYPLLFVGITFSN